MSDQQVSFFQLFRQHSDGSLEPLKPVRLGGIQMGPGVRFGTGVSFGGIDLTQHIGRDFLVDEESGISIIKGIF